MKKLNNYSISLILTLFLSLRCFAHTVELIIFQQKTKAQNNSNGRIFQDFLTKIIDGSDEFYLFEEGKKVSSGADELIVKMEKENGEIEIVEIPKRTSLGILKYLVEQPESTPCTDYFDSLCFAHYVNHIRLEDILKAKTMSRYDKCWSISEFSLEKLSPGDVVRLYSNDRPEHHFVVYLGKGIYISKIGTSGNLIVTDLESVKYGFDLSEAKIWKPKFID